MGAVRKQPPGQSPRRSTRVAVPASRHRWFWKYEARHHRLRPWPKFLGRVLVNLGLGLLVVGVSLVLGMWGYHALAGLSVVDSFLNSVMILSGMGPVDTLPTEGSKVFAGIYALYCGFAVLAVAGLIFSPLVHRLLHRFHADDDSPSVPPTIPGPVRKR